jgi:hypothetical protein
MGKGFLSNIIPGKFTLKILINWRGFLSKGYTGNFDKWERAFI